MKRRFTRRWQLWVGLIGIAGCGSGVSGSQASVTITSPTEFQTVQPGTDMLMTVPVSFTVQNFTLKANCSGASNCGHVVLKIDLNYCKGTGAKYNDTATASPIDAYFFYCMVGSHALQLELHHDDDSPELDSNGQVVASQTVNITLGTPDGGP